MATKPRILTKEETDRMWVEYEQLEPKDRPQCYFRRGRGEAESHYPSIEFGYCLIGHGDAKRDQFVVVAKRVIGTSPDQVSLMRLGWWNQDANYSSYESSLTLDVTRDGYWRIHGKWQWDECNYIPGIDGEVKLIFAPRSPHGNQVPAPAHGEAPVSARALDPSLPATPSS